MGEPIMPVDRQEVLKVVEEEVLPFLFLRYNEATIFSPTPTVELLYGNKVLSEIFLYDTSI